MKAQPLTIALPKGRILDDLLPLFAAAGYPLEQMRREPRRLVFDDIFPGVRVLSVRSSDVATYVQHGVADLGVAGSDILRELEPDVYEPLDLGIGRCTMVIARGADSVPPGGSRRRVATKYPKLTNDFYLKRGLQAEIIKLYGSVELAAVVALADEIVDLVSTGETLRKNNLVVHETLMAVSSRLIVNMASLKTRTGPIRRLIEALRQATV